MMMFVPNSLVRQKEGAQGRRRKRREVEKAESTGTPTPGMAAPIGPTQSGVSDAWNRRKHG